MQFARPSMQYVHHAITFLAFAVHALLGCGVHYTCQHGIVVVASDSHEHAAHDCAGHDHHSGDTHEPADEHPSPATACDHAACTFVKAEKTRIDFSASQLAFALAATPAELPHFSLAVHTAMEPFSAADISSTHLYVWHCALLI